MNSRGGMTLLEVVVALAILSALAAASLPVLLDARRVLAAVHAEVRIAAARRWQLAAGNSLPILCTHRAACSIKRW